MKILGTALAASLSIAVCQTAIAQTSIESFSPQGTIKGVRQAQARFSGQMAPFGDLRLSDPFVVNCPEAGAGRWIDGRNWSYDFERDLPAGVVCEFTLKEGVKDLAGKPLGGERRFAFSTGGPAIVQSLPSEGQWSQIDENQVFILGLDAPARPETIESNAYCRAEGINEKIGVRIVTGKQRDDIVALRKDFIDRYLHVYFKARGAVWKTTLKPGSRRLDKLPLVVLQCKQSLPADAQVSLVWGAGILSESGVATADEQALAFKTRPDFSARFTCTRLNAQAQCIPFLPMTLEFSAPVRAKDALAVALQGADGKRYRPSFGKDAGRSEYVTYVEFKGPFPERAAFSLIMPDQLKDDAGRMLINRDRFPMTVRTDDQPPLVKFPARFGIIEANGDRLLPVTVRNVEPALAGRLASIKGAVLQVGKDDDAQIIEWMKRMNGDRQDWSIGDTVEEHLKKSVFAAAKEPGKAFTLPKPNGRRAFEVIGIPLRKPGFHVVELESPKLGAAITESGGTAYVQSAALVTNLAAHFKHGAESSLVWVTSLDKGQPVPGAKVAVRACDGKLLWQGGTDKSGIARIAQALPEVRCGYNQHYFISARSGGDMTFTLSDWNRGIEAWRFDVPSQGFDADNIMIDTVFDRTLLRAGETVHMKHFLRRHTLDGIRFVDPDAAMDGKGGKEKRAGRGGGPAGGPHKLVVTHVGTNQQYEIPLTWSANGTAATTWKIPADAKQGMYALGIGNHQAGSFRVESFRVPTMKALLLGPKAPLIQASRFDLDIQLNYFAGGAASNAPVKLRTVSQDKAVSFADYADFVFANGDVKEGMIKEAPGFDDDPGAWSDEARDMDGGEGGRSGTAAPARTQALQLDGNGAARVAVDRLPQAQVPLDMLAELEYRDANGETLAVSTRVALWPSRHIVGLKPDGWAVSKDAFKFQTLVLGIDGKPIANAAVAVDFFQRLTYSHRRRLIGGFYAYENSSEVKRLGQACEGKTDDQGLLFCTVKAPAAGNLILRAKSADAEGRVAYANREVWVAGDEDWWFNASDNDRIDLIPERKHYEPGQEAVFQVRMPFREATALVTVEREGIVDAYVKRLSGKKPAFSVPIKGSHAPNVYVSAFVVRGRVQGIRPTALVDLGKPAYKMGLARIRVGWRAHELKVALASDRQTYKTREKAKVHVKVTRSDGSAPPANAEVALAAVDVGLLELMPNDSWNLLEAMMQERALQVETSTAQMQVVGKRHFGRKAVPHGGGGGKSAGRELFETLLFWKARVALDANGEADVEVPLNDALTSFRIVAIANADADLFGTGKTDIRTTQNLMLMSGLPSLAREDDTFRAGFTLRNASDAKLEVEVEATVGDGSGGKAALVKLARQSVAVEPGRARDVSWEFRVPPGLQALQWEVSARSKDGAEGDRLRIRQKVVPAVPVRTLQATLAQLERPLDMSVQLPAGALPGRGGVQASLAPRLGDELPGVREYMSDYPYTCYEQELSKAIALRDEAKWRAQMNALPSYLDGDGLVKYFPLMRYGSDVLTAYVLSIADEAGYEIPKASRERMLKGLTGFVQGRVIRHSQLRTADVAIRKMAALEALSRHAAATPDLFESFALEPNLWPTSAVIDWYLVLKRMPNLPERDAKFAQAEQILRSRLNFQGTTMGFSTERKDDLWWLMISPDVNANRVLLAMLDNRHWREDIGRLARGALGRQHKGRWNTTVANAWGVLAIEKFSKQFESAPVSGSTGATLDRKTKTFDWARKAEGGALLLPWPAQRGELRVEHSGGGKPWVTVRSLAAIPLKSALSSGYKIAKTVTPIERKAPEAWSRGDVYRVRLDLEAQSDMTWVVVDDPIPAGASILGTGLGRDSQVLAAGEKREGWVWPAFEERRHDAFRSYFEFVPKGKWSVEYTVRLNNAGEFGLPQTRVEAMYAPEMFGEIPNRAVHVRP
ncbi:MAG TPA: MG2 domain-containing protein [Paucimonas sp.]|nr:MG2 domain-containing protein [Paucimonas sp.]